MMAKADYAAIRADNERRYGTDIGRIGRTLLAERYDDRTHFIFELVQNAEDALRRRRAWNGHRTVSFDLSRQLLRMGHFGKPFDEADVRAICGIAESTHDITDIGRFGIGFKSVYSVTERPEIHSGAEDFAIESFVLPTSVDGIQRGEDETVINLSLLASDETAYEEIARGLKRLGPTTLLFLREIEEIEWKIEGGAAGFYVRSKPEEVGPGVRRVALLGRQEGQPEHDETWLVFSREVWTDERKLAGHVEIAFRTSTPEKSRLDWIRPLSVSSLVVFFPTILETRLGFLVQGPYRTTPSRDNVPRTHPWNRHLVAETGALLIQALHWLRDEGMLDADALSCLPLDRTRFGEETMFAPLFFAVRDALRTQPLLPAAKGTPVPGRAARLARSHELRNLLDNAQLTVLFGPTEEIRWLTPEISQDRTPDLRRYLMTEIGVHEITSESLIGRLSQSFMASQSEDWILRLYAFLNRQHALRHRVSELPLIRLEDGSHVRPFIDGRPQAFLPSALETGFPTVHRLVCKTDEALEFLRGLGLSEPNPVDDVIRNVLPKYGREGFHPRDGEYERDIQRLTAAFQIDSQKKREELLVELRATRFVRAADLGDDSKSLRKPAQVYLATDQIRRLFAGVSGVLVVDDSCTALRGEKIRELLEAAGCTRYLRTETTPADGLTIQGLSRLLRFLPGADLATRFDRARGLWDALRDVAQRRGLAGFPEESGFVRTLNESAWIPDSLGALQPPASVIFEALAWNADPVLLSRIHFKPSTIEALAREAGIEPAVLDLLKRLGLTSAAELMKRLGVRDMEPHAAGPRDDGHERDIAREATNGSAAEDRVPHGRRSAAGRGTVDECRTSPAEDDDALDESVEPSELTGSSVHEGTSGSSGAGTGEKHSDASGRERHRQRPPSGRQEFISYVAVHPDDEEPDPDGLSQVARRALEEEGIRRILEQEPGLQRTLGNHPGYDLFELDATGEVVRWVEAKAMTRDLSSRPVGVSHTQFECARERGEAYWLYVVENAGQPERARVLRIRNPAGRARTFTFDRGWREAAASEGAWFEG